jgi:hypothetical protein
MAVTRPYKGTEGDGIRKGDKGENYNADGE